jgi:CheY-like chemotaxis protein
MAYEFEPSHEQHRIASSAGVLIADDEEAVRSVLETWLRRGGFEVWSASHGGQAVELYRRHRDVIAAVLLDVRMPGMDGPNTLVTLQKICPSVPCCFMTGDSNGYTEEALLMLGAVRVFQKPFAFAEVIEVLHQLVSRRPRRGQNQYVETLSKGA